MPPCIAPITDYAGASGSAVSVRWPRSFIWMKPWRNGSSHRREPTATSACVSGSDYEAGQ
jgi:hypothetical protein